MSVKLSVFVLGYHMEGPNSLAAISSDQVFSCQELILSVNTLALDYAFIKLDRAVDPSIGEPSAVMLSSEPLSVNDPLVMIGFSEWFTPQSRRRRFCQ